MIARSRFCLLLPSPRTRSCLCPIPGSVSVTVSSARSPAPTINFSFFSDFSTVHFSLFSFTLIDSLGIGQVGVVVGLTSVAVRVVVRGLFLALMKTGWFGLARKAVWGDTLGLVAVVAVGLWLAVFPFRSCAPCGCCWRRGHLRCRWLRRVWAVLLSSWVEVFLHALEEVACCLLRWVGSGGWCVPSCPHEAVGRSLRGWLDIRVLECSRWLWWGWRRCGDVVELRPFGEGSFWCRSVPWPGPC